MYPRFTFTNDHSEQQITRAIKVAKQICNLMKSISAQLITIALNNNRDTILHLSIAMIANAQIECKSIAQKNGIKLNNLVVYDDDTHEYDMTFLAKS
jgi:uncharacterized OsmC-like protein